MAMYYQQIEPDWWLCNSNYHQMVQVMIRIVQNSLLLRVDAPEWHPNRLNAKNNIDGKNDISIEENNKLKVQCEDKKIDEWKLPKHAVKENSVIKHEK